jgi:hypothetical protein
MNRARATVVISSRSVAESGRPVEIETATDRMLIFFNNELVRSLGSGRERKRRPHITYQTSLSRSALSLST